MTPFLAQGDFASWTNFWKPRFSFKISDQFLTIIENDAHFPK